MPEPTTFYVQSGRTGRDLADLLAAELGGTVASDGPLWTVTTDTVAVAVEADTIDADGFPLSVDVYARAGQATLADSLADAVRSKWGAPVLVRPFTSSTRTLKPELSVP